MAEPHILTGRKTSPSYEHAAEPDMQDRLRDGWSATPSGQAEKPSRALEGAVHASVSLNPVDPVVSNAVADRNLPTISMVSMIWKLLAVWWRRTRERMGRALPRGVPTMTTARVQRPVKSRQLTATHAKLFWTFA